MTEVQAWTPHPVWPQGMDGPMDTPPVPETLDWDVWLGPAPFRPYNPAYLPARWRGWLDFGTGGLGDMGCHIFDHIFWAMKLGAPTSVEASCSIFVPGTMNWDKPKNTETYPQASIVTYRFPAREGFPPLKLTWYDGGLMPPRPEELAPGREDGRHLRRGALHRRQGQDPDGVARGQRAADHPRGEDERLPAAGRRRFRARSAITTEWIAACKGGPPAGSNFEYAAPLTELVLLGCAAIRCGEKLDWDSENMRFPNFPEADQYLRRANRAGWTI